MTARRTHPNVAFGRLEVRPENANSQLAPHAGAFVWVAAVSDDVDAFMARARSAISELGCTIVGHDPIAFTDDFRRVEDPTLKSLVAFAVQRPAVAVYDELFTYEEADPE